MEIQPLIQTAWNSLIVWSTWPGRAPPDQGLEGGDHRPAERGEEPAAQLTGGVSASDRSCRAGTASGRGHRADRLEGWPSSWPIPRDCERPTTRSSNPVSIELPALTADLVLKVLDRSEPLRTETFPD